MKTEINTRFTAAMLFNSDKALVQDLRNTHDLGEKEMMRAILTLANNNAELLAAEVQAFKDAQNAEREAVKAAKLAEREAEKAARLAEREAEKAAKAQVKADKAAEREAIKAAKQAEREAARAAKAEAVDAGAELVAA